MIAALDIGSSKIVAIIGSSTPEGELTIDGVGKASSKGIKNGVVVNIDSTTKSIRTAINEAELMAGRQIKSCFVNISGVQIDSLRNSGMVTVNTQEVSEQDIERVIEAAQTTNKIPPDHKILHKIPQDYTLDGQEGIPDPLGMSGVRLESTLHLVTCPQNTIRNLEKCINGCDIEIDAVVLSQYAESFAVLEEDQKEIGVCLIKIGAGTTDIAVFLNGSMIFSTCIPVGGILVTKDISLALRTSPDNAEEIKVKHACAMRSLINHDDEPIKVPNVSNGQVKDLHRQTLVEFVEPRYEEIFLLVLDELRRAGIEQFIGTTVLTGGAAIIHGAAELAEEIFHMPVSIGYPSQLKGMNNAVENPAYATSVGLLLYGIQQQKYIHNNKKSNPESQESIFRKINSWFRQY